MLWGTSSWSHNGRAAGLAERLFDLIRTHFVYAGSGLPRHSVARYRAHTVSFGSIVYFLRAIYAYGEAFDSDAARELFTNGVARVLTIQGDDGGWPWMIDVRTGRPIDLYPIFTVHQDSMAMLFLFPAEDCGIPRGDGRRSSAASGGTSDATSSTRGWSGPAPTRGSTVRSSGPSDGPGRDATSAAWARLPPCSRPVAGGSASIPSAGLTTSAGSYIPGLTLFVCSRSTPP